MILLFGAGYGPLAGEIGRRGMRVIYWVAKCKDASDVYSIRARTRVAVEERLANEADGNYDPPKRVITPEFAGTFDLLVQCLSEGRAWWEDR